MRAAFRFEDLVAPEPLQRFFETRWEKCWLHVPRKEPSYFDEVLTLQDLDRFFEGRNTPASSFRVTSDGRDVDSARWSTELRSGVQVARIADPDQLFRFLDGGATLIINGANRAIPSLDRFAHALEAQLGFRVAFNIYITPPERQGFHAHFDDHDVFVLQISGSKAWRIYDSPIPLAGARHIEVMGKLKLGKPEARLDLAAGDSLYLPRGLVHEATGGSETSVHITLGLHPFRWCDLLSEAARLAEEDPVFRQAIPHGLSSEAARVAFRVELQERFQLLLGSTDVEQLVGRSWRQFLRSRRSPGRGRFLDLARVSRVGLNTCLRRRPALFAVEVEKDEVAVTFGGRRLGFPRFMQDTLKQLTGEAAFIPAEIEGLIDDDGRIELARCFVRAGFLEILDDRVD